MALKAYKYYRLWLTRNYNNNDGYFTINEVGLFENGSDGTNLCIGATATAHSSYQGSTGPENAIDGSPSTFWESGNAAEPKWIKIELAQATVVRLIYLSSTQYGNEIPADWILQGSSDNISWDDIASFKSWATTATGKSAYEKLNIVVQGTSTLETGGRSARVLIHDWETGALVATVTPKSDGSWQYRSSSERNLLVTHIGPVGFQPWSDGPVTPLEA